MQNIDKAFKDNYLKRYKSLFEEYELVKSGKHKYFKKAKDFYTSNKLIYKTFLKYYNRYKQSHDDLSIFPSKRGPKYRTRRTLKFIEDKVLSLRINGSGRYEIFSELKPNLGRFTPSPSTVYNICKRYNLNKLSKPMKQNKRKIIKQRAGELGHIDCHYLHKGIVRSELNKRYFLVAILDDCTRLVWAEVVEDIKSLTVMFSILKSINILKTQFNIQFEEVITDNGAEFGGGIKNEDRVNSNPFRRMLKELGVKHRFTKPYRPETNGKIERFWKTLNEDLIEDTDFDSIDELRDELTQYLVYYNHGRVHQGIGGKTPVDFRNSLPN